MSDAQILESNVDLGDKAEKAYNLYVKDFIEDSRESISLAFEELSISDIEGLQTLKLMQHSIGSLEKRIFKDMDSRKLAQMQLNELANEE